MSKLAAAVFVAATLLASACKKKGASKDEETLPRDTTSDRTDRGGDDDRDGEAGQGTVSVDGDDGDAPDFGRIYFEFDSSTLTAESRATLQRVADWMASHASTSVTLEGHADARGTDEYNLALGQRRAEVMHDYLVRLGVADARVKTISYGEERPAADGDDEGAYAQNRRGELVPR